MRPDERANEEEIRRSQGRDKLVKKGAGLALGAASTALGIGAASKIMPFINEYIPLDLAIKGISKVNPQVGNFLKKGQSLGLDMKEGLNFIKENLTPKKEEQTKKINPLQDFETNYPDIANALANTMKQGQSPDAAAGILKTSSSFGKQIKKLEKEVGKNFVDYVLELFGPQGGSMQQAKQDTNEPLAMTPEMYAQHQAEYQRNQGQQGQPQSGNIKQDIMAGLAKIMKM